jgi:hypothetical protein
MNISSTEEKELQTKLQHIVKGFMNKLLNEPELKYA